MTTSSGTQPLDVQVEETGPCSRKLRIKVPAARVDRELEETYRNVEKAVQFPGFRPGKAPRKLVEARLGARVLVEVRERLVQAAVDEAIDAEKLKPVGAPRAEFDKIEIARGRELEFEVELDVRPDFELPDLAALTVERPTVEVTDAHVDAAVEQLRRERATSEEGGDEPIAEGDVATLAVRVSVGEETVAEAEDVEWHHPSDVLGGVLVEGLAASLVGKRRGEEVTLAQKLPADFRDEQHRGKEAAFTLRVEGVTKVHLPEVSEDFAREMDYDSIEELRTELRRGLERRAETQRDRALDTAIVDRLLEAVPFEVPPALVAAETDRLLRRYEVQLREQGVPEDQIAPHLNAGQDDARQRVVRDLRASFLLDRVATARKVFVTESEIQQEIAAMAARYNRSTPEMEAYMERQGLVPALRAELRERKTLRSLRDVVQVTEPSGERPQAAGSEA